MTYSGVVEMKQWEGYKSCMRICYILGRFNNSVWLGESIMQRDVGDFVTF